MRNYYSSYGANELKRSYQRNMLISLAVVSLISLVIAATILSLPVTVDSNGDNGRPVRDSVFVVLDIPEEIIIIPDYSKWDVHIQQSQSKAGYIPVPIIDSLFTEADEELEMYTSGSYDPDFDPDGNSSDSYNQEGIQGIGDGEYYFDEAETFEAVEIMPVFIRRHLAVYPRMAKRLGIEGIVWVKVLIDEEGRVIDTKLGRTSGLQSLDDSALAAAGRCLFKPGIQNGRPVKVWVGFKYEFKLKQKL